ncbi:MAG: cell division protein ZapA [Francisellaceae bacterium]|nr:cell division protein ZapA [Francisellaceae bacterium]MBT6208133.1 cell division protein ZapA [Francisellaceae bacterium]MBT6539922.1 cell division protein ZapA [Francisellaceae bacterium]
MTKHVAVQILGKDYQVACPEGEEHNLIEAAYYLDGNMQEVRKSGRVLGPERAAIMAALNIANELLQLKTDTENGKINIEDKVSGMSNKISKCLIGKKRIRVRPERDIEESANL